MAKKDDTSKSAILGAWDRWASDNDLPEGNISGSEALNFFLHLQNKKSTLLDFKSGTTDKWQTIHGWLLNARRVKD